jgi:hypothetical protein
MYARFGVPARFPLECPNRIRQRKSVNGLFYRFAT